MDYTGAPRGRELLLIDGEDGTLNRFTAVCAPLIYRGDRLPAELYGNAFVAEPAANFVSRIVLSDDGTTIRARKAYDNADFLASTDERFRPVYISNAPDGTLYVVDMYRGIIQDRASTTIYLRDHITSRKLDAPVGLGRIYRVVHETTKRDTTNPFAKATPAQLVEALSHPNGWRRDTAQRLLAATIVRGAQDAAIQNVLASIGDTGKSEWQRSALLRGAEGAVLNAPMPGTAGRRGAPPIANAPCPTCPGGRAGPGGAYACERPATTGGRGAGARTVRLAREPTALSALAAAGGELGARAGNVLARIEWPGKPGVAAPVPALNAEEQQRFDAGREVYRNNCQQCHQPDGRGQERLAPSLVGSPLTLAAPGIPARILLGGKEGPIGLMPPVGSVLSDDQIAGVLTYIRREWGQTGTPVDSAQVKTVRGETASRTRPWTHDELMAMIKAAQ
jgi:mono/diheme cytochrome c family protein